jgi:hypothetical protein
MMDPRQLAMKLQQNRPEMPAWPQRPMQPRPAMQGLPQHAQAAVTRAQGMAQGMMQNPWASPTPFQYSRPPMPQAGQAPAAQATAAPLPVDGAPRGGNGGWGRGW